MTKSIILETDDPKNPKMSLKISLEVIVEVGFEKSYLHLRDLEIGKEHIKRVNIQARLPEKLNLGLPSSSDPALNAQVLKDKKGSYSLELKVLPKKIGSLRAEINLPTGYPEEPMIKLRVSGEVNGPIKLKPKRITIHPNKPGRVILSSDKEHPFKIEKLTDPQGRLQGKIKVLEEGLRYEVQISPTEKGKQASRGYSAKLLVLTDSKEQPELKIRSYYRPKSRSFKRGKQQSKSPFTPIKALKKSKP